MTLYLNMFGITRRLICDRGTNFTDSLVQKSLLELGIQQHFITKSAPRGNGQVERYVGTVTNLLRAEITNKTEWPNVIQKLQNTLNTTAQKTTGFSPVYLLTGVEGSSPDVKTLTASISLKDVPNNLLSDRELAYERMKKQADLAKNLFDKKRRSNKVFVIGDYVYHPSDNSHLAKLDDRYLRNLGANQSSQAIFFPDLRKIIQIFVTEIDTDVGKTTISSWLCLHTGYSYFKPIQTGSTLGTDSHQMSNLTNANVYKENFVYKRSLSPHLAASLENDRINIDRISLPKTHNLIIKSAGGALVPINKTTLMVDLIKKLAIPTMLVARSTLSTINHTLLNLEALHARNIPILGIILNGLLNQNNIEAIEFYGRAQVLASVPKLQQVDREHLMQIPFSNRLKAILE
ncbi:uncharacterized protein, partial [Euwallacea similis]|uniref:uncharacterized protein n=1 Tax=Euwallacea similis TaxID=1736056 RepID=UPI00344EC5F7